MYRKQQARKLAKWQMSEMYNTLVSGCRYRDAFSTFLLSLDRVTNISRSSWTAAAIQKLGVKPSYLPACLCFTSRSGCMGVCVCLRTQLLEQELMNLHDFSAATCSALWGFALTVSPPLSAGTVLEGGCPRLLSGERRANLNTPYPHTRSHAQTTKKPHDDDCSGFGCHGNSCPPPQFSFTVAQALSPCIFAK